MKDRVALHNLGCKVNAYEIEAMQQMLEENGYEIVPFAPGADIYIINTCTVTNIADRKSRQMLHRAKKMNPDAVVVAAGCYVQAQGQESSKDPSIDLVIGNNNKKDLIRILEEYKNSREEKKYLCSMTHTTEYEELEISRTAEHTRAYIKVQDGCNQFCTYCIIPYTRGRVRSREKTAILEEVKRLARSGYKEVVLTGIHLSSYGLDMPNKGETLLSLILAVHEIEGIERIRLGSLEPRIITEEFAKTISAMPKICPHFHLSLQSGCDATLKRMNRRYDSDEYFEKCVLLRKYFRNPAITTDVIVGFPQETREEFEQSRAFVEKVNFYETHIFKYSKRQGTKAASMDGQVAEQEKAKRSQILISLGELQHQRYLSKLEGEELEVLFEEQIEIDGEAWWCGHTKEYIRAVLKTEENLENEVRRVRAVRADEEGFMRCTE